jgi:uncharacterized protein
MDFNSASRYIVNRLQQELQPSFSYHCVEHTLDVMDAARRISDLEDIEPHALKLIETACLYHDAGMIVQYADHESASVSLAKQTLPGFGYSGSDIDEIARLIMVTKLPQQPCDHLEQIICDADLDYLGRDDYLPLSFKLQFEWKMTGFRPTTLSEWLEIQIKFLSDHQYFTKSAIQLREGKKIKNLEEIKRVVRGE